MGKSCERRAHVARPQERFAHPTALQHCRRMRCSGGSLSAAIFGPADWGSQSGRGDVSTFRKAQKHIRATPKQSSKSSPPNSATRITSLLRVVQTFQPATQAQRLGLCPNQDWPRHRPDKLANTRQNLAWLSLPHKVWASRNTHFTSIRAMQRFDRCRSEADIDQVAFTENELSVSALANGAKPISASPSSAIRAWRSRGCPATPIYTPCLGAG